MQKIIWTGIKRHRSYKYQFVHWLYISRQGIQNGSIFIRDLSEETNRLETEILILSF